MWEVVYLPAAEQERGKLPGTERAAIDNAMEKLQNLGPQLPYPHSSAVRAADRLRELRPRAGRCPWRALYRRVDECFVIAAIAPDGGNDPRGFRRACEQAEARLTEIEEHEE
jgi:hypothetical protein